jgi:hypothetical protein
MEAVGDLGPEPRKAGQPAPTAAGSVGTQCGSETNYLRQYMAQLRHKLEDDPSHPRHLLTEPGMGYRLHLNDSGQLTEA